MLSRGMIFFVIMSWPKSLLGYGPVWTLTTDFLLNSDSSTEKSEVFQTITNRK